MRSTSVYVKSVCSKRLMEEDNVIRPEKSDYYGDFDTLSS